MCANPFGEYVDAALGINLFMELLALEAFRSKLKLS
jgi:hypothetical protein